MSPTPRGLCTRPRPRPFAQGFSRVCAQCLVARAVGGPPRATAQPPRRRHRACDEHARRDRGTPRPVCRTRCACSAAESAKVGGAICSAPPSRTRTIDPTTTATAHQQDPDEVGVKHRLDKRQLPAEPAQSVVVGHPAHLPGQPRQGLGHRPERCTTEHSVCWRSSIEPSTSTRSASRRAKCSGSASTRWAPANPTRACPNSETGRSTRSPPCSHASTFAWVRGPCASRRRIAPNHEPVANCD